MSSQEPVGSRHPRAGEERLCCIGVTGHLGVGEELLCCTGVCLDTLGQGRNFFAAAECLSGHPGVGEGLLGRTRSVSSASSAPMLVFIPSAYLPGQACSVTGDVSILCSMVFQAPSLAQCLGLSDHGIRQ